MVFKTKKFIDLVKNHKCIYDKSCSNKKQRDQAWTSIAKQMNLDVKVLQDKWLILKKNFELHLLNKNDPNFSKLLSSKFPFAQELKYLIPYIQKKEAKSSIEKSVDEHLDATVTETVIVGESAEMSDSMVVPSTSSKNNIITTKDHIVRLKPIVAYIANVDKKDNDEPNDGDDEFNDGVGEINDITQNKNDAITLSLSENEESEVSKSTQVTLISEIKDEEAPKDPLVDDVEPINEVVKSPVDDEKANKIFFHNILKCSEMSDEKKLFNSTQKAINDITMMSDGGTTDEENFLCNDLFSTSIPTQEVTAKTSNVGADETTQPTLKNDETNVRKEERMEFDTKNDVNFVEGEINYVSVPSTTTAGEPKSPSHFEQTSIAADGKKKNTMESQLIYSFAHLKNNLNTPLPTVISTTIGKVCEVADFSAKKMQQEIDAEKAHPISSVDIPISTQSTELIAITAALDQIAKENAEFLMQDKITKTKHVAEAVKNDPPAKKQKTSTPYIIKKKKSNYFDELDDLSRDKPSIPMPICDEGSSGCNTKALERTVGGAEDSLVNLRNANSIYEVQKSNEADLSLQRRNTLGVFFLAMAQTVNQFSPRRQAKVQREISDVVFSAAEERYNEGSNIAD